MVEHSNRKHVYLLNMFLTIVLIWLAWRVLTLGMADAMSRSQPEQALQWRSQQTTALFILAEQQSKDAGLFEAAKKNAREALRANPLEGRAYRLLGQISEIEKKPDDAYGLFQSAVRYSPRDLESRLWLLNYALRTANADDAIKHLDIMLRVRIDLITQLIPTIAGLAVFPDSQKALVKCLEKKPAWRSLAISSLLASGGSSQRYAGFINRLERSEGGLSEAEQRTWVSALNQSQQWSLAYLNWATQLPAARQLELGNLFNGSFENEPLGSEFDWQFSHIPGASIDRIFRVGASGEKALRVSFDDRRVLFNNVKQTLVLPAGYYRLSGKGFAEELRTEIGLIWAVECLGGGERLAATDALKGSSRDWQAFSVDFEVPKGNCLAQNLQLSLPARVPSEQQIAGVAWFDALRIQRIQKLAEPAANQ